MNNIILEFNNLKYSLDNLDKSFFIYLYKAIDIKKIIYKFLYKNKKSYNYKYVSLGQMCLTATYLQKVHIKTESYPFDWILTSADIVYDCLNTKFKDFIHPSFLNECNKNVIGNSKYHINMFKHKNPLHRNKDKKYYERCIIRFNDILENNIPVVYIINLVDNDENNGWSMGFTGKFKKPINQTYELYTDVINFIKTRNRYAKFIFIKSTFLNSSPSIKYDIIDNDVLNIHFKAIGFRGGREFKNKIDDLIFQIMYSGLINNNGVI